MLPEAAQSALVKAPISSPSSQWPRRSFVTTSSLLLFFFVFFTSFGVVSAEVLSSSSSSAIDESSLQLTAPLPLPTPSLVEETKEGKSSNSLGEEDPPLVFLTSAAIGAIDGDGEDDVFLSEKSYHLPISSPTSSSNSAPSAVGSLSYNHQQRPRLKVLNLNAWGLAWPWSQDRAARFRALREVIALSDYDVVLLQEVWFRSDYKTIHTALPYVTHYDSFNTGCSGVLVPLECSGLVILSRHPIEEVEFKPFSFRGSFWNFDGEILVEKGVGRARVRWHGLSVDVFTSHLVSYTNNPNSDNTYFRFVQSMETSRYIARSDADVRIFGGDINALPLSGPRQPYTILSSGLRDALLDKYPDVSFHPWFATFGNRRNTYSKAGDHCPERIDILMFRARDGVEMRTEEFVMPMFMTRSDKGDLISISDHEALHAEFTVTVHKERRPEPVQYHPPPHRRPHPRYPAPQRHNLQRPRQRSGLPVGAQTWGQMAAGEGQKISQRVDGQPVEYYEDSLALSSSGLPLGGGGGGQIEAAEVVPSYSVERTSNVIKIDQVEEEEEEKEDIPDNAGMSFSHPVPAQNILK